ncbi:hypothetical protein EN829_020110 [Mesorhizobium sp. M00.F.Ca.ET.186.01.1.1]|nr:hypothetical protein EN848_29240 [bacterium M00.F.Ca.ET.205.01.1.1]TGU50339.1 hypothetical protein EN795_22160 [bacterium M00.F.Ca.ET.152.01.1.1]TGV33815.1 hypothetical protein EN829_020110 [Mesorhizobium sp. M00.F.Ca.ET.186.01.1.1]TGZ40703.1 hypothetical protein EN805_21555 [bacterium M00.F.Ca.ET.162.01.1.1]
MPDTKTALVHLARDASDEDILAVVRRWSDTLAVEDYEGALAMVRAPDWTVDLLQKTIAGYGHPEPTDRVHKVTPLASARYYPGDEPVNNPWPRHEVDRDTLPNGEPFISVWFDMPFDGYWSDVTATFDVDRDGDMLVLTLEMIHIM